MVRHYVNQDAISVLDVIGDARAAAQLLSDELGRALGIGTVPVDVEGSFVFVPPLREVVPRHRALTEDDYLRYDAAADRAASLLPCRTVRAFIEVIYLLDWDRMGRSEFDALGAAYSTLPGWIGFDGSPDSPGLPRWFGHDEERGPYLTGSVEPPGLQVCGVIERPIFGDWHQAFLAATRALPYRALA